jgi:hypothetical protein
MTVEVALADSWLHEEEEELGDVSFEGRMALGTCGCLFVSLYMSKAVDFFDGSSVDSSQEHINHHHTRPGRDHFPGTIASREKIFWWIDSFQDLPIVPIVVCYTTIVSDLAILVPLSFQFVRTGFTPLSIRRYCAP